MRVETRPLSTGSERLSVAAPVVDGDRQVAELLHDLSEAPAAFRCPVHQHHWRTRRILMMANNVQASELHGADPTELFADMLLIGHSVRVRDCKRGAPGSAA